MCNSRMGKTKLCYKSPSNSCLRNGSWGLTGKGRKGTLWGGGSGPFHVSAMGCPGVCICQRSLNCNDKIYTFHCIISL